jgi:hypothetical protein
MLQKYWLIADAGTAMSNLGERTLACVTLLHECFLTRPDSASNQRRHHVRQKAVPIPDAFQASDERRGAARLSVSPMNVQTPQLG